MINFDVIVVGGGHAGCEAAAVSSRFGAKTALITNKLSTIGIMSCNPAIGGLGKGHLVREIDALDGLMGYAADISCIQYRLLNRKKGPAVRGPRGQIDRDIYKNTMQMCLMKEKNLVLIEDEAVNLEINSNKEIIGISLLKNGNLKCCSIVLTTGTFLHGTIYIGKKKWPGGRIGENSNYKLTENLINHGIKFGRLKTGTPPRLDGTSIDWNELDFQNPDENPVFFSLFTKKTNQKQIKCFITRTNVDTHKIIRENLNSSSLYSGKITGIGPRYCPSIEDKIVKFGDRNGHQIFLEPESIQNKVIYPNGISTSFPEKLQDRILKTIKGLQNVKILQPGYAVEYNFINPIQLHSNLEMRSIKGLFLAGQINGTTGYEEAAAQGIVAGINAARKAGNSDPIFLLRTQSYIGVMIDDLVTKGIDEPYRMFTSRSEFRLSLRIDNSDQRLTPLGIKYKIISKEREKIFLKQKESFEEIKKFSKSVLISPNLAESFGIKINLDGIKRTAYDLLSFSKINIENLIKIWPKFKNFDKKIFDLLKIDAQYSVYTKRQIQEKISLEEDICLKIPKNIVYQEISGLSNELKSKLIKRMPNSIHEVKLIDGMTPVAIFLIIKHIQKTSYLKKRKYS